MKTYYAYELFDLDKKYGKYLADRRFRTGPVVRLAKSRLPKVRRVLDLTLLTSAVKP